MNPLSDLTHIKLAQGCSKMKQNSAKQMLAGVIYIDRHMYRYAVVILAIIQAYNKKLKVGTLQRMLQQFSNKRNYFFFLDSQN